MKKITIYRANNKLDELEIYSDDFVITYVEAVNCYGFQCKYDGETEEYNKLLKVVRKLADTVRELEEISNEMEL